MAPVRNALVRIPRMCALVWPLMAADCGYIEYDGPRDELAKPDWGALDVPTNPVILAERTSTDPIEAILTNPETGATVGTTVATLGTPTGDWSWITPVAELDPNTTWRIELLLPDEVASGTNEGEFVTGTDPDLDPPTGGEVQAAEVNADALAVHYSSLEDPSAYIELQVAADADFEDGQSMPVLFGGSDPIYVGALYLPDSGVVGDGDTLFLRSRAIDLAGNAGEWSDTASVEIGSCSAAPARGSWWGLLLCAGVLLRPGGRRTRSL